MPARWLPWPAKMNPAGAGDHGGGGMCCGDRGQPGGQVVAAGAGDDGAVLERGPCGGQGVPDVGWVQAGMGGDEFVQPPGLGGQAVRGPPGHRPGHRPGQRARRLRFGRGRAVLAGAGGGFGHDEVGVGAADAEGGDPGPAGTIGAGGPRNRLGEQLDVSGGPVHVRGRLGGVQGGREDAVLQGLDHLDDAGCPGRGLRVPEVGLD
jgi:hypothetical protein